MHYTQLRPFFFILPPETAHRLALIGLKLLYRLKLLPLFFKTPPDDPVSLWGLTFKNKIGLAAGLDKNGDYIDALGALGFGFVEVGTATPRPQRGNPKPRLFRLPKQEALVNRMGFNNKGIDHLVERIKHAHYQGVIGINIGKNADTPIEQALDDYLIGLEKAYPVADYITINISSPNTLGLRTLQNGAYLTALLKGLDIRRQTLKVLHQKTTPLFVKVAPDLSIDEIHELATAFLEFNIDGVIVSNTTKVDEGGLSGAPLFALSTQCLIQFHRELKEKIPLIGSGGILTPAHAEAKLRAGASLIQVYTGLIYRGAPVNLSPKINGY